MLFQRRQQVPVCPLIVHVVHGLDPKAVGHVSSRHQFILQLVVAGAGAVILSRRPLDRK